MTPTLFLALALHAQPTQAAPTSLMLLTAEQGQVIQVAAELRAEGAWTNEIALRVMNWAKEQGLDPVKVIDLITTIAIDTAGTGVSVLIGILPNPDALMDELRGVEPRPDGYTSTGDYRADGWGPLPDWMTSAETGMAENGVMGANLGGDDRDVLDNDGSDPDDPDGSAGTYTGGADDDGLRDGGGMADDSWYTEDGGEEGYPDDDEEGGSGDYTFTMTGTVTGSDGSTMTVDLITLTGPDGVKGCLAIDIDTGAGAWAAEPCEAILHL